jgi:hypothetical protein
MNAMKNFIHGMSTMIKLFPSKNRKMIINIPSQSDEEVLKKDWEIVGKDIMFALENDEQKLQSTHHSISASFSGPIPLPVETNYTSLFFS